MAVLPDEIKRQALAATHTLARLGNIRAAYVFGSQVDGRGDRWSDIDVAAFLEGIENWDIELRANAMVQVMEEVGWNVEAHIFPASSYENPPRASFAEYILKHRVRILG